MKNGATSETIKAALEDRKLINDDKQLKEWIESGEMIDGQYGLIYAIQNSLKLDNVSAYDWYIKNCTKLIYKNKFPPTLEIIEAALEKGIKIEDYLLLMNWIKSGQKVKGKNAFVYFLEVDSTLLPDQYKDKIKWYYQNKDKKEFKGKLPAENLILEWTLNKDVFRNLIIDVNLLAYWMMQTQQPNWKDSKGLNKKIKVDEYLRFSPNLLKAVALKLVDIYIDPKSTEAEKEYSKQAYYVAITQLYGKAQDNTQDLDKKIQNMSLTSLAHKISNIVKKSSSDESHIQEDIIDGILSKYSIEGVARICEIGGALQGKKEANSAYNLLSKFVEFVKALFPKNKEVNLSLDKMMSNIKDKQTGYDQELPKSSKEFMNLAPKGLKSFAETVTKPSKSVTPNI